MRERGEIDRQLEELIIAATDPTVKAQLILMQKLSTAVESGYAMQRKIESCISEQIGLLQAGVRSLKADTDRGIDDTRRLIEQGRGGLRVAKVAISVLLVLLTSMQCLIVYVYSKDVGNMGVLGDKVARLETDVAVLRAYTTPSVKKRMALDKMIGSDDG